MPLWSKRLLLALSAPLVVLLALELLCRACGVRPTVAERPFRDFDLGWSFVTGTEPPYFVKSASRFFEPRKDARGVARTDGHAFRGGEHPPHHARMLRVAILGDSTAFGFGVRYGDSFAGLMQQDLARRHPTLDVDVVDEGCPAYSTWQNAVDLDERVLPLAPDVVVLALSGFNDATGAVGLADAEWARVSPLRAGKLAGVLRASRFAALVDRWLGPAWGRAVAGDPEDAVRAVEEGRAPSGRRVPLASFVANESAMLARIGAAGALPVVLVHAHPDAEIAKDPERARYTAAAASGAQDAGAACVLGASVVPTAASVAPPLYFDKIHPNEEGHRRLAAALVAAIDAALAASGRFAAPASGAARPTLAAIDPPAAPASGGGTARVTGTGFLNAPRFFVGGEPAELVRVADDAHAEIELPPVAPGRRALSVVTANGSAELDAAFEARGPTLAVTVANGRASVVVTGRPREHASVNAGTAAGSEPIQLGRVLGIRKGTLLPTPLEIDLDANGEGRAELPVPDGESGTLYVQAFVVPREGEYPRVMLPTETVEVTLRGK